MRNGFKISVALCTYNGERFIVEQLQSILGQTVVPDEIVVCDDASSDATMALVAEFAQAASCSIQYHRNAQQLGVAKNFERAISLCCGDIIFLCDQDDVWLPQKVATMVDSFQSGDVALVFSNGFITDSRLAQLGYNVWDTFRLNGTDRARLTGADPLAFLIRRYAITGATMAFRATLKPHILPIHEDWVHDAWIACLASCSGSIKAVDQALIYYRQHENNVIGGNKLTLFGKINRMRRTSAAQIELEARNWMAMLEKLQSAGYGAVTDAHLSAIRQKIKHLHARSAVFHRSFPVRAIIVLGELASSRYSIFSEGLKSAFVDLFLRAKMSGDGGCCRDCQCGIH